MIKPLENDSCEAVQAYFTVYSVSFAAALWCGIAPAEVQENLDISTQSARGIYKHPYIPCLEPRCRAIHDAIDKGLLPCSRENGKVVEEHVAVERRHVSRQHLKDWIAAQFPSDKPAFLFDDIERDTHSAISADAYRSLQADREALQTKIEKAREEYKKMRAEKKQIEAENLSLREQLQNPKLLGPRSETTYLNIIGSLVAVMLGRSPAGKANSVFDNQSAVISNIVAHYGDKSGISQRTLEEKFAAANKSLEQ